MNTRHENYTELRSLVVAAKLPEEKRKQLLSFIDSELALSDKLNSLMNPSQSSGAVSSASVTQLLDLLKF